MQPGFLSSQAPNLFTKKTQGTQVRGCLPGWVEILAWSNLIHSLMTHPTEHI